MATYRVYWLDKDDHIRGAANLDCGSHAHAERLAAVWLEMWPSVELWLDRDRVALLSAEQVRPSAPGALPPAFDGYGPEHWRDRAEEARVIADGMRDAAAKRTMQRVALEAERLAAAVASHGKVRAGGA